MLLTETVHFSNTKGRRDHMSVRRERSVIPGELYGAVLFLRHFGSREEAFKLKGAPPAEVAECHLLEDSSDNRRRFRAQSLEEAQHPSSLAKQSP